MVGLLSFSNFLLNYSITIIFSLEPFKVNHTNYLNQLNNTYTLRWSFGMDGGGPVSLIITVAIHVAMSQGQRKTLSGFHFWKNKIFLVH